jgi:hypothetical protein
MQTEEVSLYLVLAARESQSKKSQSKKEPSTPRAPTVRSEPDPALDSSTHPLYASVAGDARPPPSYAISLVARAQRGRLCGSCDPWFAAVWRRLAVRAQADE